MRYSTSALVVAAFIGEALAGPTHAHLHQRAHQKKDIDYKTVDYSSVDFAAAYAKGIAEKAGSVVAAAVATTTAVSAAKETATKAASKADSKSSSTSSASAASSSAATSSGSSEGLLNGIVGVSNSRTTFGSKSTSTYEVGDLAVNNCGSPYGSNIIKVASAKGYDFTNTFVNTQSKSITVNVWNKIGSDGQVMSGSTSAPKDTTLTFVLAPGASQTIAVQENSNIGWAEATTSTKLSGQFDTTFGEATFLTAGSGMDVSAIPNSKGNTYNMSITSAEDSCISDMTQNMWLTAEKWVGDSNGSCYIAYKTATLTTKMGGNV